MRRASRVDENHALIRNAYRSLGCSAKDTFMIGQGFPDLVVAIYGITDLVEVKDGSKTPSRRKLTPDEITFHNTWNAKIWIIESVDDVIAHVNDIKRRFDQ